MIAALIQSAVKRRKVVLAITFVAALFGFSAYKTLPREAQPDITVPYVNITVPYPGVSPEDSERLLVRPLEVELKSLEGLIEMNSISSQGAATVVLEFPVGFNKDRVLADVRAKVDMAKGRFPPDAMEPIIEEYNTGQEPVITAVLHGPAPERELYRVALDLQKRAQTLPGVLRADIYGGREEMLEVTIDPLRMTSYGITAQEIAGVIQSNNQLVPAGDLQNGSGRFAVKIPGVVEHPVDILALPIKTNGDRVVTLGDVAEVHRTFKEVTTLSRLNGEPSLSVAVIKRGGANLLETAQAFRSMVADDAKSWPSSVKYDFGFDRSEDIGRMLLLLESGLIIAVILVMIIIVASLGLRAGLLVGAAIPACFMLGFLLLKANHFTLNQMVMFGLVLAVGMLVDGSIVVVEYADRKMAEGFDKKEAYAMAGERMFWPVFNGIATTLCAFVPFLFWNTLPGKFMSFLPITLFFVLASSIFVALIFTPALGSIFGSRPEEHGHESENIRLSEEGDPLQMTGFMGWYARFVEACLRHAWWVLLAGLGVVASIIIWFAITPHKTEFFLDQDPEWVTVYVKARGNLSADAMDGLVRQVETRLQHIKGVEKMVTRVGGLGGGGPFGGAPADSIGSIQLDFVNFDELKKDKLRGADIVNDIRNRLGEVAGVQVELQKPRNGPAPGKDVQIELRSADIAALEQSAARIRAIIDSNGELADIEDSRTSPGLEWNLSVDREAAGRYGVSVLAVGQAVQFATNGVLAGRFRPDDSENELDIRVRFPADERNLSAFDQLTIATPSGSVPASYFLKRVAGPKVDNINRRNGERLVIIQANAKPGLAANQVIAKLKPQLQKANIAKTVTWKFRGGDEETQKAGGFFVTAMGVSLFMMAVILLWQFNSFWGVACTLFAVVLSTIGVLLGIQVNLFGTFNYISFLMTGTGVVALAGVIVGHNIVLVDTFFQVYRSGQNAKTAALRAAVLRFRPVLLTTLTAVVGLLPLMFQIEPNFRTGEIEFRPPGAEFWVQMAASIVWGLTFATVLTLLITPVMLGFYDGIKRWFPSVGVHAMKGGKVINLRGQPDVPEAAE
jgi:multidrug efflux pump